MLQNKINNKIYVGQTNNLAKRRREHKAKDRLKTKGSPLYCSIAKYGFDSFIMMPIEEHLVAEETDVAEEFWIQYFNSRNLSVGYNLAEGGRVNRGFKHTDEFKSNKSKQMTLYYSNNRPYNVKLSEEDVNKIRNMFMSGNYSTRELSSIFRIDRSCISDIIKNKSYKNENYKMPEELFKKITEKLLASRRPRGPRKSS